MSEQQRTQENGSCWDEAPHISRPGECEPMVPRCELKAGHLGAHRSGRSEWIRNPSSFNQVSRERDVAVAAIERIDVALRSDARSAMRVVAAREIINDYRDKADG